MRSIIIFFQYYFSVRKNVCRCRHIPLDTDGDRGRGRRPRTRALAAAVPRARFVRFVGGRSTSTTDRTGRNPMAIVSPPSDTLTRSEGKSIKIQKNSLSRVTCSTTRSSYFFVLTWQDIPRRRRLGPGICVKLRNSLNCIP